MKNIIYRQKWGRRALCQAAAALFFCPLFAAESLPSSAMTQPVERSNTIGFRLNARAGEAGGNSFFSPYALYSAFSMAYDCARENTAAEMRSVFGFTEDREVHRREAVQLRRRLIKAARGAEFRRVSAFWYQKGYELLPEYEAVLKSSYSASAETADFRSSAERARAAVNAWTEKQTGGLVAGVFEPGSVTQLTRLALVSAAAFKGSWKIAFSTGGTSEQEFSLSSGEKVTAQLMFSGAPVKINYFEDEEFQAAGLDYLGGGLRMLVLLPGPGKSAAALGKALSQEKLAALRTALSARLEPVLLYLPRFKISSSRDLAAELSALGMPLAFSEDADYSGMTGRKGLYLQKAAQKVFLEVDEGGSGTVRGKVKMAKRRKKPPVFRADRPFVFLVEDKLTGLILFMGRLEDPNRGV